MTWRSGRGLMRSKEHKVQLRFQSYSRTLIVCRILLARLAWPFVHHLTLAAHSERHPNSTKDNIGTHILIHNKCDLQPFRRQVTAGPKYDRDASRSVAELLHSSPHRAYSKSRVLGTSNSVPRALSHTRCQDVEPSHYHISSFHEVAAD